MTRPGVLFARLVEATATPVLPPRAAAHRSVSDAGGEAASWVKLDARIPRQEQTQWCWCATALGVHQFYEPAVAMSQCEAANAILERLDACTEPASDEVNRSFFLDRSLDRFGNFSPPKVASALALADVRALIDGGAPLGARIGWPDRTGHFMVIEGYLPGADPQVAIHDPIFGESDMAYDQYATAYQGTGKWTHSYRTRSHLT
jgi:Papain-like cysteine protease AvrRpt2